MKTLRAACCAIATLAAGDAVADSPVVVELFTSQGCANCPPADRLLGRLAERDDVIALALHVDYWDYIGWEDTFADPSHTARQHAYAHAHGSTVVYTPQMIVDGEILMVGSHPMEVMSAIMDRLERPEIVSLSVTPDGPGHLVRAEMQDEAPEGGMIVQLVRYSEQERVEIQRGENAHRTFDYHNIVRSWQVVAEWDGAAPYAARITTDGDAPHVVIIQAVGHGPILAAARLD